MTFVQVEFLWFFAIVLSAYWLLPRRELQNGLLLVASMIFYGWVHPWFLILLYGSACLDYAMGLAMRARPERKRWFLAASMAGNLGLLGYFKYADFFIENVAAALESLGLQPHLHTLGVFLPVGISFYTFQTMSYSIDVYRGQIEPRRNFVDYMVFVSFFPQLVAGPVERAGNLLAQIEQKRAFDVHKVRSGTALAMWGAFKKVCIADVVAPYVDKAFMLTEPSGPLIWAATLGFAVQILADFSGYTDIARGISRIMGFELIKNFDHPYLARNPSEFWRRWHISFSSWIRDYVYIPLGGSRGGFWGATRATFGAMMLSGLWHGAAWTFVLWGAYHAALLTGYRLVTPRIPRVIREARGAGAASVALMFGFTVLGWMIFRETRLDRLVGYLTLNPFAASHEHWVATVVLLSVIAACSAPMVLVLTAERHLVPRLRASAWYLPIETTTWAVYAVAIFTFVRMTASDFIYFQF